MKDRFNPTTPNILDATETMLHWGLPTEIIAKALEHLKGLQRLRDMEMECKAARIHASVIQAEDAEREQAHAEGKCILPREHHGRCVPSEHINAYQRAANAMAKPEPKS